MVSSYKGGSGKSLLSLNLANIQATGGKKVLLIEGDLDGPIFHRIFTQCEPDTFFNGFLQDPNQPLSSFIYNGGNLDVIYASPRFKETDLLESKSYSSLLDRIMDIKQQITSLHYDVVIIDLLPGVNYIGIASIILANIILMVLRPDPNAVYGVSLLIKRVYSNTILPKTKEFRIIFNQMPDYDGFDAEMDRWEIVLQAKFPIINHFYRIPLFPETAYNFINHNALLPVDDPIIPYIQNLIS